VLRTARASVGGYCYHSLKRGDGRALFFHDADDLPGFVRLLSQACARVSRRRVRFCLMPNHFQLVLGPPGDGGLGPWVPWLRTAPVQGYRQPYGSCGHVWQGRFETFAIAEDEHRRTLLRLVERNPPPPGRAAHPRKQAK
jgi:putative transposase